MMLTGKSDDRLFEEDADMLDEMLDSHDEFYVTLTGGACSRSLNFTQY